MERLNGSDPRLLIIPIRMANIKRIIAVLSSKGGVGKTIIATLTALIMGEKGYRVGLLDLDFTNPSTHVVLGINPLKYVPEEEKGIIPPLIHNIRYLSIAMYVGDKPLPLRGEAVDNVFRELLAITRWGELDYLFIDTPPGIGDEHLNLLTYLGDRVETLLVSIPSPLAIKSVAKLYQLLRDGGYRVLGLIENMARDEELRRFCIENGIEYLGKIPLDPSIDESLGDIVALKNTIVWRNLSVIVEKLV